MELVEAVSALPAAERSAWLSLQCPDEPALVAEVMDRVEWEAKMGDFLRDPIVVRSLSRAEAFAPGALVAGRYRIAREIGRGRWSTVLEALDTSNENRVALKLSAPSRLALAPPPHPGLVQHLEYNEIDTLDGRTGFSAVEYLEGPTLADRLRDSTPLTAEEAQALALRLCQVLIYASLSGLQPASLNTNDLILTPRGPVLICEWLPTHGKTDRAGDLTLLGLVLRRITLPPSDSSAPAWARIVRRCLGQAPETRYKSLRDLERDLQPHGNIVSRIRHLLSGDR